MRSVIEDLERLRRGARWRLIVQRLSIIGAWTIDGVLAFIAIDFLLRLPAPLRLLIGLGGLATLLTIGWRSLSSAVSFMPSLTQLALRVEQLLPALQGRLASSVEFASSGVSESNILAARSVSETESRLAGESLAGMVDRSRTLKAAGALVLACTVFVTLVAFSPASAQTGVLRLIAPYGSAQWPARTGVVSLMNEIVPESGVFPKGESLTLRARSTMHPEDRITAVYRSQSGGSSESGWNRIVLTHQSAGVHERLIDTNLPGIDLYFETEDARTTTRRIDFVPPPAIRSAVLHTTPPDYAEGIVSESSAALGPGTDNRAVTDDPILDGSRGDIAPETQQATPRSGRRFRTRRVASHHPGLAIGTRDARSHCRQR